MSHPDRPYLNNDSCENRKSQTMEYSTMKHIQLRQETKHKKLPFPST